MEIFHFECVDFVQVSLLDFSGNVPLKPSKFSGIQSVTDMSKKIP
jgi:hypothetical protein